jgi:hypothetical protein
MRTCLTVVERDEVLEKCLKDAAEIARFWELVRNAEDAEAVRNALQERKRSPYSNVSGAAWRQAHEWAADKIWNQEKSEREPTQEEIETALDEIDEHEQLGIGA